MSLKLSINYAKSMYLLTGII